MQPSAVAHRDHPREHLESQGVAVEFGTGVTSIEDDPDGLRVMLDAAGTAEVVTAAYVLERAAGTASPGTRWMSISRGTPMAAGISSPT